MDDGRWQSSCAEAKSGGPCSSGGRKDVAAESYWLFNQPTDVAFGKNGETCVSDGYGNSRVVKFDRDGNFLKSWGKYGTGPGEFNLPHSVAVDKQGNVYVWDRENKRIQIFDADGNFLKEWTGVGYPYGLFITKDQHVWMIEGGYDRILEFDQNGKILGALGEPVYHARGGNFSTGTIGIFALALTGRVVSQPIPLKSH